MDNFQKLSRLTPAQFKRVTRAAKHCARVTRGIMNFDTTMEILIEAEHARNEARRTERESLDQMQKTQVWQQTGRRA